MVASLGRDRIVIRMNDEFERKSKILDKHKQTKYNNSKPKINKEEN